MIRNIFILTRKPQLHKKWVKTVVEYIRENYVIRPPEDATAGPSNEPQEDNTVQPGNPPQVDAIVGPDTHGFVFDLSVASKLNLPYIPICEVGEVPADPADDPIRYTYTDRRNKVNLLFEIIIWLLWYPDIRP